MSAIITLSYKKLVSTKAQYPTPTRNITLSYKKLVSKTQYPTPTRNNTLSYKKLVSKTQYPTILYCPVCSLEEEY